MKYFLYTHHVHFDIETAILEGIIYTKLTVFSICTGEYCPKSISVMAEGNISGMDRKTVIALPRHIKNVPKRNQIVWTLQMLYIHKRRKYKMKQENC